VNELSDLKEREPVIPASFVPPPFQFPSISFMKFLLERTFLLLSLSLLLSPPIPVSAEPLQENYKNIQMKKDVLRGINLLYDLELEEAEKLFYRVVENEPDDPIGHFYMAMVSWSKLSSGFWTQDVVKEYTDRIDKTITVARKSIERGKRDSFTYFYLGGALGFKGRFELMRRNWFSAADLAWQAVQALNTCSEMDPENKDVLLGLGIYDYYTAKLSGALKWLTYLFFHKGDKEEGLQKLHRAAKEAIYSSIESKSMLIHIYMYMEEEYSKALPFVLDLSVRFKNNPRYKFFEGIIYSRLSMDEDLTNTVEFMRQRSREETSATKSAWWVRQAFYLEASHSLWLEQYSLARLKLDAILAHQDPLTDPGMIGWPLLKKGMSFDLEGERQIALEYYNRVLALENGAGAQFLAAKFIQSPPENRDRFLGY
jgi:tetratricopeptide (TPR) repeat protein